MNRELLRPEVQDYLEASSHMTLEAFAFKKSPFPHITIQELLQQLQGHRIAQKKLPSWHACKQVLYPPKRNLEQTSSEWAAQYKAGCMEGVTLADLTGGFGVDSYAFSQSFKSVHYIEREEQVFAFAKANFEALQVTNVHCTLGDGIHYLKSDTEHFDVIYLDPGRRHQEKGKVFLLEDCEPNIVAHLEEVLKHCNTLWVKTAPLLDITSGLNALSQVSEIHIIAIKNEVKELLWKIVPGYTQSPEIITINLNGDDKQQHRFPWKPNLKTTIHYILPQKYLYEPNAALMKAGAFHWIAQEFQLAKLHPNSHLFTSNTGKDFPGRVFEITAIFPYRLKTIKKLGIQKANITTRNFKISVAQLRQTLKIKDGGDDYLFFTTTQDEKKVLLVCKKV